MGRTPWVSWCCSMSSTTTSDRTATIFTCIARSSSIRRIARPGAPRSTSTAPRAGRCVSSSCTTRSTGQRSIASTGCGSMPCTPFTTRAGPISFARSPGRCARDRAGNGRCISFLRTTATRRTTSRAMRAGVRCTPPPSGTTTCITRCTCSRAASATVTTPTTPLTRSPVWGAHSPKASPIRVSTPRFAASRAASRARTCRRRRSWDFSRTTT